MIDSKLNDILNSHDCDEPAYVISDYMKRNLSRISVLPISEVARACFVSKGQISKFVKRLGYESYSDFKDSCVEYLEAQEQKKPIFDAIPDLKKNVMGFTQQYIQLLEHIERNIDYGVLRKLIKDMEGHREIHLFAQGEARSICQILQIELGNLAIPIGSNNTDFSRPFCYSSDIMILIISINGRSFSFNKNVMKKILDMPNDIWVIICSPKVLVSKNKLIVPTTNDKFNEFAMRFAVDIIIAQLRQWRSEKGGAGMKMIERVSKMETFHPH